MPKQWQSNPESPVYARQQLEAAEMQVLAQWLDARQLLWCHCPNEGKRTVQYRVAMAKRGVKAGVPDVLIFTPPPCPFSQGSVSSYPHILPEPITFKHPVYVGSALELKAGKGRASPAQKAWLDGLAQCGWLCSVQVGASNAIRWLQSLGY